MSIKTELEKLPTISVGQERYVKLADVLALLAAVEAAKRADERKS